MNDAWYPEDTSEELQRRFGRNFRDARIKAGLSQTAAADRTGTSQTYLSQVELGTKNLTLDTIAQLAGGIGLSVESLLFPAREKATLGELNAVVGVIHREIRLLLKVNGDVPITGDMIRRILRNVSIRFELHSEVVNKEFSGRPEK